MSSGDRVLFYVSAIRRFAATATVASSYFPEEPPVWEREGGASWPYRVKISPEVVLDDAQCIDANLLAPRLEYVKRWPPENWHMAFQGNLHLLPKSDFLLVEEGDEKAEVRERLRSHQLASAIRLQSKKKLRPSSQTRPVPITPP